MVLRLRSAELSHVILIPVVSYGVVGSVGMRAGSNCPMYNNTLFTPGAPPPAAEAIMLAVGQTIFYTPLLILQRRIFTKTGPGQT